MSTMRDTELTIRDDEQRPGNVPADGDGLVFYPTPAKIHARSTPLREPVLRVLALDTTPQASALLMLAVDGDIPKFDLALYPDRPATRPQMLAHLALVQQHAIGAGIPILRVETTGSAEKALHARIREILGFPEPRHVPADVVADLALPASLDTIHLAVGSRVPFLRHTFPLLELGWALGDCQGYLRSRRLDRPGLPGQAR
ncbi:hypothetical protein [Actinomadura rupiterrae]|uniref:hypothetical protein n=1 Tax=Actinomadura rupiterrae TaxID=559627 RepID=UPI0020A2FF06|nr:hypothetical protein [Actinomadura rupiterrae]MCP2337480.1 hypothetical protein [Actinomadura rupiterrae]